jgi:hypothetical protein
MPTLLDVQRAIYRSLAEREDDPAAAYIIADGLTAAARLSIYRNTFVGSLTTALRVSYPAVHRLVGAEFFEGAAAKFIEQHIPRRACLDDYGAEFADFLEGFAPVAGLPYLPGVARLEWAVNVALHVREADALDPGRLATAEAMHHGRIILVLHPSVGLVHDTYPVDAIWRAVLAEDDAAIAAIDLDSGPVWLLVGRGKTGVDVTRIREAAWRFTSALRVERPLQAVLDAFPDADSSAILADHLAEGRFTDFRMTDRADTAS